MLDILYQTFGEALAYVLIITAMILIGGFGSAGQWLVSYISKRRKS